MHGPTFEELNREAERQGLTVGLDLEGRGDRSRFRRVTVLDPREERAEREVVAIRLGAGRSLEDGSAVLLTYLRARRGAVER